MYPVVGYISPFYPMTSPGSAPLFRVKLPDHGPGWKGEQAAAGIGRLIEPDGCDVAWQGDEADQITDGFT